MRITCKSLDVACLSGLVVLAVGGGVLAVRSAGGHAKRMESRNESVEARIGQLREAQLALSRLDRALRANRSALDALRRRLPESEAMGGFLSNLGRIQFRTHSWSLWLYEIKMSYFGSLIRTLARCTVQRQAGRKEPGS